MFVCKECGKIFEEPKEWDACPYCEGNYDDAVKCIECGEYSAKGICNICEKNICEQILLEIVPKLKDIIDNYTKKDIDMLHAYLDKYKKFYILDIFEIAENLGK